MRLGLAMVTVACLVFQAAGQQFPPEPRTIPERVARGEKSIRIVHETDAIARSAQELVNMADLIVVGRVVDKASLLSISKYHVVTDETVQIEDVLYSHNRSVHPGDKIDLRHLGGVISVDSARVEEVEKELPTLENGELYLFLAKKQIDAYVLIPAGTVAFADDTSRCVATHPQGFAEFCGKRSSGVLDGVRSYVASRGTP